MTRQVAEVDMKCPVCEKPVKITIELDGQKSSDSLFTERLDMTYKLQHVEHLHSQHSNMYVLEETIVETGNEE